MNTRIKALRNTLHKSQEEFGKYLGLSKSGVSEIEAGRRNVTDQHIIMLKNCSEFNINEDWLRYGKGEMFLEKDIDEEIATFIGKIQMNDTKNFKKRFISALSKLDEDEWEVLEKLVLETCKEKD